MDNQYTSYYLYKKYQAIGGELIDLGIASIDADGTMPTVIKNEYDPACGYIPPTPPQCKCSAYTYSFTSATVSSAATSITLSYTGCSKLDLASAATYNWIAVGSQTYNTGTSVGNIIANISANTSSSRSAAFYLSLDGTGCNTIYISQQSGATPVVSPKYVLTLNDSSVISAECDSTSAISRSEISAYSASVTSAVIGDCVTEIDNLAFWKCSGLTSVTIPDSVMSVGGKAFADCSSLPVENNLRYADTFLVGVTGNDISHETSYTIKNGTRFIGDGAFSMCHSITSVGPVGSGASIEIPNSVIYLGGAFYWCVQLTTVVLPNSITRIGEDAFVECRNLTTVIIPDSVTYIEGSTFIECGITDITIPTGVTTINTTTFRECRRLSSVTIPNGVTTIDVYAFYECPSLTGITIPSSVTSINSRAFAGATFMLTSNFINNSSLDEVANNYWGCKVYDSVVDDFGVKGTNIVRYKGNATSVTIPTGYTSIGDYAFYRYDNISAVTISETITSIGEDAFIDCDSLRSVTCFATTPPTLRYDALPDNYNLTIYVPSGSLDAYKTAWSAYASKIQAIP